MGETVRALTFATIALIALPATAQKPDRSSWGYKLATIGGATGQTRDKQAARLNVVLPAIDRFCQDLPSSERVADVLVVAWRNIQPRPDLPELAEETLRLAREMDAVRRASGASANSNPSCMGDLSMYATLRNKAYTGPDARDSLIEIAETLLGV